MSVAISPTDLISDITAKSPRAVELLAEYGLVCAHCPLNRFETLESGAQLHGLTPEQIGGLVKEINALIKDEAKTPGKSR